MKNNRLSLLNVVLIFISTTFSVYSSANINGYDTSRIYKVMAKAKNGEDVKIAVFGGSITAGSLASSESKRWANLVTDWWKNTFSESNISLLNAGIGGTGSDIGVHRLYDDVLVHNPDLVIVEFAVNDAGINSTYVRQMMEGIVRQCYMNKVAVMFILLKMETMGTAQADHKIVGDYYMLPMVSWADLIDAAVAENGKVLQNVFGDSDGNGSGVHPNDAGMQYIADFLIDEFEIMYSNLPEDAANIVIPDTLPAPLISDNYDKTYKYNNKTLVAASNSGWVTSGNGWIAEKPGDEISFVVDGNAVSLIYSRHNDSFRGKAEVWVDDKTPQKLDAYWTQTWGPANVFCLVAEGLDSGQHTLHVKIIKESTTGNERHYFQILNVLKAGNIVTLAPIAKAGDSKKIVIGTDISLDGSDSFDPDSTTDNITYTWAIVSAPNNSAAVLSSNSAETSSITPDMEGYYKIGLIVNDGIYNSVQNVITIHAVETNSAPLADAGADAFSLPNEYYELNGSNSSDPDGDPLDYKWRVISYP
ncbi:MAG: hypothetical protein JXB17_08025, partial [Bacteroidales bacterium]|nr:hypothetical protein [Bacteroidales bacterium]